MNIKSMTFKTFLFAASFLLASSASEQDFVEDFKAINRAYVSGNLSFDLKYDYYNDHKAAKPSYSYAGKVKLNRGMVYYKINGMEFSYDSIYTCMADHNSKTIMIDTVRKQIDFTGRISFIDSLGKAYKKVEYKDMGNGQAKYTIYSLLPGISHSEIVFDKSTKLIQKISIFFLDNRDNAVAGSIRNKLVITYSNINTTTVNARSDFKAQRLLNIKGRKVKPIQTYKHYSIINNME